MMPSTPLVLPATQVSPVSGEVASGEDQGVVSPIAAPQAQEVATSNVATSTVSLAAAPTGSDTTGGAAATSPSIPVDSAGSVDSAAQPGAGLSDQGASAFSDSLQQAGASLPAQDGAVVTGQTSGEATAQEGAVEGSITSGNSTTTTTVGEDTGAPETVPATPEDPAETPVVGDGDTADTNTPSADDPTTGVSEPTHGRAPVEPKGPARASDMEAPGQAKKDGDTTVDGDSHRAIGKGAAISAERSNRPLEPEAAQPKAQNSNGSETDGAEGSGTAGTASPAASGAQGSGQQSSGTDTAKSEDQIHGRVDSIAAQRPGEAGSTNVASAKETGRSEDSQGPDKRLFEQLLSHASKLSVPQNSSLRVQLRPPTLGYVDLRLGLRDGVLTLQILAESDRTRDMIQGSLPQLRQALEGKAIEVGQMSLGSPSDGSGAWPNGFAASSGAGQWLGSRRYAGVGSRAPERMEPLATPTEAVSGATRGDQHLVDYRV